MKLLKTVEKRKVEWKRRKDFGCGGNGREEELERKEWKRKRRRNRGGQN
jgi:hypothetical protein